MKRPLQPPGKSTPASPPGFMKVKAMENTLQKPPSGSFWQEMARLWFWIRRSVALILAVTLGWSFFELVGPPVLKEMIVETFPFSLLLKKESAVSQEERIRMEQDECPHIAGYNFCPLCGKRTYPWEGGAGWRGR